MKYDGEHKIKRLTDSMSITAFLDIDTDVVYGAFSSKTNNRLRS